ncbi:MAG TPA: preprotein translocase subunit YajC [Gemmatimonadetes bacterium]|nr:preprotein translocase subunit YajC [Gemmatimonadota bacterium]HIC54543.1 preprotein translocase subunit YajC [Gemmatimonadota bacterium]HIN52330.1 preprotein translocase subunit YajC [Gemmatimonadota bacterium]
MVQMVLIFAIFYFLMIRPQAKERKKHDGMLKGLKKGDEIVTNGGIIGKVVHVDENRLTVKTGENTRITVDRGRVASVMDVKGKAKEEREESALGEVSPASRSSRARRWKKE